MHPVIQKTFGGLTPRYYFRQLIFGLIFPAMFVFMLSHGGHSIPLGMGLFLVINTLLYPYSRFVYESVVEFVIGNNLFLVNAFFMLFVKLMTMSLCFCFALFIAPIGLIYLYFHNSTTA